MTDAEAIDAAREWVGKRREVRAVLIRLAREANPVDAKKGLPQDGPGLERDIRKVWQFPHDLSEDRLLNLIDNGEVDIFANPE